MDHRDVDQFHALNIFRIAGIGRERRRNTATAPEPSIDESAKHAGFLERETGFEPATLSLGRFRLGVAKFDLTA
jgi:hypothetical protein